MRKVYCFLAFCIFVSLFAFNAVSAKAAAQLTYSNFFPPTHIQSKLAESWCKEVEKRTNGEVIIQYFPASTLTKPNQTYDGVVNGIADIGMTALAYTKGRFPASEAIDLPIGYSNGPQATRIANAFFQKFKPEEFKDTQIMFLHAHGPGLLHTIDKKVEKLEDLKGLKIRAHGTSGLAISALGGTPVGQSMREAYQMLQKGVVDGSVHPLEANKGWKLGEVLKYVTASYSCAYTTTFAVFMNKDKWNSLSSENQNIISKINEEWAAKHGKAWDESDKEGLEFFKSQGGQVVNLSEKEAERWKNAVSPVIDEYIKSVSAKGIDGKAVVEFINTNLEKE